MKNEIIVIKNGNAKTYELPKFGSVIIKVVNGKPELVETTTQEKI